jgi:hypothetical protein
MTTNRNHITNPVGYALCVGLNNFENPNIKKLLYCSKDVEFWSWEFKRTYEYESVQFLLDENATIFKFICAIWSLASKAVAGDIVCITISSHGFHDGETNFIELYDRKMSENTFRFFLRAFKPNVRVFVITDACQSGTFVDTNENAITEHAYLSIKNYLTTMFPSDHERITTLFETQKTTPITASVIFMASSSDNQNVNDGIFVRCTKELLIPLQMQSAESYQLAIYRAFKRHAWNNDQILELILMFRKDSHYIKKIIDDLAKEQYHLFYLSETIKNDASLGKLIEKMREWPIGYDGDEGKFFHYALDKVLYSKYLMKNTIPTLSFHGKKSRAFQNQFVFYKSSSAYQSELMR